MDWHLGARFKRHRVSRDTASPLAHTLTPMYTRTHPRSWCDTLVRTHEHAHTHLIAHSQCSHTHTCTLTCIHTGSHCAHMCSPVHMHAHSVYICNTFTPALTRSHVHTHTYMHSYRLSHTCSHRLAYAHSHGSHLLSQRSQVQHTLTRVHTCSHTCAHTQSHTFTPARKCTLARPAALPAVGTQVATGPHRSSAPSCLSPKLHSEASLSLPKQPGWPWGRGSGRARTSGVGTQRSCRHRGVCRQRGARCEGRACVCTAGPAPGPSVTPRPTQAPAW